MYDLKINQKIGGFTVTERRELADISATLYEMVFDKNGAKLIFLDRDDENKTFSVGFKTVPENSTGVFHIIEHSVLCGSSKFPVKEPFVELLKGSLQTFLNAVTFPDKTVYPIATRNNKDFFNLADVYLDAVFNPLMKQNPNVFFQEGWRRELSNSGKLSYNGVVFNEMKGAYSSPEELGATVACSMLYGESCYGYDSGGNPDEIPKLSYESFVENHNRFYHPSNAYFFLDGNVELEKTLDLIKSYIGSYSPLGESIEIKDEWRGESSEGEIEYEISSEESEENKTRLIINYLSTRFDEQLESLGIEILIDAISSGNESPVKKALLDSGLCEKLSLYSNGERMRNNITVEFQNVKDGKLKEVEALFQSTLLSLAENGIDKEHLAAAINHLEFVLRERDTGGFPIGVAYNFSVFDTWLYGGNPAEPLCYTEKFSRLRELLKGDYFEGLIKKYILDNEKYARLVMRPSATLGQRRAKEEEARLEKERGELSDTEIDYILKTNEALLNWQSCEDSEEALATIPMLSISDIPKASSKTPTELVKTNAHELIRHEMKTGGICYTELFFDASDTVESGELQLLPLFAAMLKSSATEKHEAFAFQNLIKRELGSVTVAPIVFEKGDQTRVYIKLGISFLDGKKREFLEILEELLYSVSFDDKNTLCNIVRQSKMLLESGFATAGDSYGFVRSLATENTAYAIRDSLSGYGFFNYIKETEKNIASLSDALLEKLSVLKDKLFRRERLTLSVSGERDTELEAAIVEKVSAGGALPQAVSKTNMPSKASGIVIPAQVGFAVTAARLCDVGEKFTGALNVARMILNYEYLWVNVRVKGGAYGVSFRARRDGTVGYTSYRDPSPAASLSVFSKSAEFLRGFVSGGAGLTKYIIGAMGEFEPLRSAPMEASISTANYLSGYDEADYDRIRAEILETDKSALLAAADLIERLNGKLSSLIVAPRDMIKGEGELLFV